MPIFEYECRRCGKQFEHLHRTRSEPAPHCPDCGAPRPEKLLSAFSPVNGGGSAAAREACPTCPGASSGGCAGGSCPFG
jgi:putative FmdB family regulatory protein